MGPGAAANPRPGARSRGILLLLLPSLLSLSLAGCSASKASAPKGPATVALPPANPVAVGKMVQGVQAAKDGQKDRAAGLLREAIALDANLWEARYDLGAILGNEGDLAGSEESLALAAKLAPDSQDVAVALADVRRRRGEAKEAAYGLSDFVQDHPNAVDARTLFVASLRESGQIDKAIAEAREVLVRKPADASALAELSLSHLAKGEKEAAALLAKQALDSSPNSAVAHRATGLLDLANGDDAEAFAEFRKAADADPRDTTSRLNMGVVLLHAGAYAKAEEQYREILKVSPDDTQAQVGLAAALRGGADAGHPQKLEEARGLLEKVLAADPHETSALFNLGVLYADFLKRPADAAPYFKRFLTDAPSDHPLRADADKYMSAALASAPPQESASASPGPAPASPPARPSPPAPAKK
jgi:tetratricopeptide (TPR) repeat protein